MCRALIGQAWDMCPRFWLGGEISPVCMYLMEERGGGVGFPDKRQEAQLNLDCK